MGEKGPGGAVLPAQRRPRGDRVGGGGEIGVRAQPLDVRDSREELRTTKSLVDLTDLQLVGGRMAGGFAEARSARHEP